MTHVEKMRLQAALAALGGAKRHSLRPSQLQLTALFVPHRRGGAGGDRDGVTSMKELLCA